MAHVLTERPWLTVDGPDIVRISISSSDGHGKGQGLPGLWSAQLIKTRAIMAWRREQHLCTHLYTCAQEDGLSIRTHQTPLDVYRQQQLPPRFRSNKIAPINLCVHPVHSYR